MLVVCDNAILKDALYLVPEALAGPFLLGGFVAIQVAGKIPDFLAAEFAVRGDPTDSRSVPMCISL